MSTTAAVAIYSSVGTGMLALTGIVFSLVFVMVQFSAVAHSPRLVLWIARDRVIWHSLGVFTATFIYSMAAIAWLDRDRTGRVLFFSGWLVVGLLLASVGMFIALVDRVAVLQINQHAHLHGGSRKERHRTDVPATGGANCECVSGRIPEESGDADAFSQGKTEGSPSA